METKTKNKKQKTDMYYDYINSISKSEGFKVICDLVLTSKDTFEILDYVQKNKVEISSDDIYLFYDTILNKTDKKYKAKVEYLIDYFLSYLNCYEVKDDNFKKIIWAPF